MLVRDVRVWLPIQLSSMQGQQIQDSQNPRGDRSLKFVSLAVFKTLPLQCTIVFMFDCLMGGFAISYVEHLSALYSTQVP